MHRGDELLAQVDPEIEQLISLEEERQRKKIILIASESICHPAVRRALDSVFTNLYAEGYPAGRMLREETKKLTDYGRQLSYYRRYGNRRYYKGTEYVDFVESLAQRRCAELFATDRRPDAGIKVSANEIFVNVQPLSGAAANNAVYEAFLKVGDTVMGLSLTHGGHLTHGSEANRSGKNYRIVSYLVNEKSGKLDYGEIGKLATECRPKMIIAGYSAYPWSIDWEKLRRIADSVPGGAILMADVAHTAGLIAAGKTPSPVGCADVITFTTHKTLCGPRGAVVMTTNREKAALVDGAVFPGEQGGPHINSIAARAVAFKVAAGEEFKRLQERVLENAQLLAKALEKEGLKLAYGGTDSHMVLVDLKAVKTAGGNPVDGETASRILDLCGITCNKNTIAGDENAAYPGGIRFGTTWVSQLGMGGREMTEIARLVKKVLANIHPFIYEGKRNLMGRGKIDLKIMEEVKAGVAALMTKANAGGTGEDGGYPHFHYRQKPKIRTMLLHEEHEKLGARFGEVHGWRVPLHYGRAAEEAEAVRTGCVLSDLEGEGLFLLAGERADLFLQAAGTGDLLYLEEGRSAETLFLDEDGNVKAAAVVVHIPGEGKIRRYLLHTAGRDRETIRDWLRALSDGYVLFDRTDVFRKVDGPVEVHDLSESMGQDFRLSILRLEGSRAPELVKEISPPLARIEDGEVAGEKLDGFRVLVNRRDRPDGRAVYDFYVRPGETSTLWNSLLAQGKKFSLKPVGVQARSELEKGSERGSERPELCGRKRTYFIGQRATGGKPEGKEIFRYQPETGAEPRKGFLCQEHKKLSGSKFVPFAGWEMPVWFSRISEEHRAVRETAALFDVTHMGVLEVEGAGATRFLDNVSTNYVPALMEGQAHYSYLLDAGGEVLDDILIFRREQERYMVVVNAANNDKVKAWLTGVNAKKTIIDRDHPEKEVEGAPVIRDLRREESGKDRKIDIALQGPNSLFILREIFREPEQKKQLERLGRFEFFVTGFEGREAIVSRSGYTGEEVGFELYVHPEAAARTWNLLLGTGERWGIRPTGLGARDSARTEAGLPLYGHELAGEFKVNPHQAGYGCFVKLHKPFFIGRKPYLEQMLKSTRKIARFRMEIRGVRMIRPGNPVLDEAGREIGAVTSSVPIEGIQCGMALIDKPAIVEDNKIGIRLAGAGVTSDDKSSIVEAKILSRFPEVKKT